MATKEARGPSDLIASPAAVLARNSARTEIARGQKILTKQRGREVWGRGLVIWGTSNMYTRTDMGQGEHEDKQRHVLGQGARKMPRNQ